MYKTFKNFGVIYNTFVRNNRHYTTRKTVSGLDYLRDNTLNKHLAFTLEERQALGLNGLLAAQYRTMEEQIKICKMSLARFENSLKKYLYLCDLQDSNEKLFYNVLNDDLESLMPVIYAPTAGLAGLKYGLIYKRPRGLFISINDWGNISAILRNWPNPRVRAICFTDGEKVLGFGDLGSHGLAIPVGKLALYTAVGGIHPSDCLPIVLDVGTDNKRLLEDPFYIGLRQPRIKGKVYEEFIDEFMLACRDVYGPACLLQFEDFSQRTAFNLLTRYKNTFCTFNDDIQGSGAVALAGLLATERVTKKKLCEHVYLFYGAGAAAIGTANLLVDAMVEEGVSKRDAHSKIWMFDKHGLLSTRRPELIPDHALVYSKNVPEAKKLTAEFVANCKATALLGLSTVSGAFTPHILGQMARNCKRPIIFALSNPIDKAECTPQQAYDSTEGQCIYASGSLFPPIKYNGKIYQTSQANNSFIFPGVALGVTTVWARQVPDQMFLAAAKVLAKSCSDEDLDTGRIYPPTRDIKKVTLDIAEEVAQVAYHLNIATRYSKPKDMRSFIEKKLYDLKYKNYASKMFTSMKSKSIYKM